jgi:glutamine synthetase
VNPYLGYAATIVTGLHGIQNKVEAPAMYEGNAYEAKDVPRVPVPSSLHEAIDAMENSEILREGFGDYVFGHLLNMARQEQIIFDNNTVTDWELVRYFERG